MRPPPFTGILDRGDSLNGQQEIKVLAIDDDLSVHEAFRKVLKPQGEEAEDTLGGLFDDLMGADLSSSDSVADEPSFPHIALSHAYKGEEGAKLSETACAQGQQYHVAIVDMRMPLGWDGLETMTHLLKENPALQIIICTAFSDHNWAELNSKVESSDALLILKKPFDGIELRQMVFALGEKYRLQRETREQTTKLKDLLKERDVLLNGASDFVYHCTSDGVITYLSPAFQRIFGLHLKDWQSTYKSQVNFLSGYLQEPLTLSMQTTEGKTRIVELVERPSSQEDGGRVGVGRDITDRVLLEGELRRAHKLEAVGRLAGGLAHDFNNLLTIITAEADFLAYDDANVQDSTKVILSAAREAGDLTRQLLRFSREKSLDVRPHDISVLVQESALLFRRMLPLDIELHLDTQSKGQVLASPTELGRVLMNLVVNATDAMIGGGSLKITTDDLLASHPAALRLGGSPQPTIRIRIQDTGEGMSPEVHERLFDPFFSTKEAGFGTGIGLSVVQEVIERVGGAIRVESEVGSGTTFELLLPCCDCKVAGASSEKEIPSGHGELILVVDDSPRILDATVRTLEANGYSVKGYSSPVAALEVPDKILKEAALLLTDVVMPEISGMALSLELLKRRRSLPTIFVSGYTDDILDSEDISPRNFIRKPWKRGKLLQLVYNAIHAGKPTHPHR